MIGETIVTMLQANAGLMALVPADRIFPYIADEKTPLPLIIYAIESIVPLYTKDEWMEDDCTFSVTSACNDYMTLQKIVKQIRVALECKRDSTTSRIVVTGQVEGYDLYENTYKNILKFNTGVNIL